MCSRVLLGDVWLPPKCRRMAAVPRLQKLFCTRAEAGLDQSMSGYEHEPDRVWDEYQWERFLQQQDHKTEKYMELLEKYLDHPQRDQIIAREMGWTQLLSGDTWSDEVDALLAEESISEETE